MKRPSLRARMAFYFAAAVGTAIVLFSAVLVCVLVLGEKNGPGPEADEDVEQVLLAMAVATPVALVGAAGAGWLLARKALEPLREAARRARSAQNSVLELDLPVTGRGDDWDELASTVNALLGTTRRSVERIRRFTSDAAHELRTPLTTVLGEAELALRRERTPEELRRALEVIHGEAGRLALLADRLLALARADEGALPVHATSVRLDVVAEEATARARARAAQGGKPVTVTLALEPVEVRVDRALIDRAIENLLDNAARHGGPNVQLALHAGEAGVELSVRDDGPGIPESLRPFLFERFACGDESRSSGGTGLGLALARAIARAHGGELVYLEGPGACFRLLLPAAANEGSLR